MLLVVHGHINDTIQSSMYGTDNSDDFWEEVLHHSLADIYCLYEQWACVQSKDKLQIYYYIRN